MWWEPVAWAKLWLSDGWDWPKEEGNNQGVVAEPPESLKGLSTLPCSWIDLPALPPGDPRFVGISSNWPSGSFLQPQFFLPPDGKAQPGSTKARRGVQSYWLTFKFAWHAGRSHLVLHMLKILRFVLLLYTKSITSRLQMMFSSIPLTFLANLSLNVIAPLKNGLSAVLRH